MDYMDYVTMLMRRIVGNGSGSLFNVSSILAGSNA